MALLDWDNSYSVGIDSIDEQHKQLLNIINRLHTSMLERRSNAVLGEILKEIIDYTIYHFSYEEGLMKQAGYKDFDSHKEIHEKFIEEANNLYESQQKGELFLSVKLSEFLINWITNHIKGSDKEYTKCLLKAGAN